MILANLFPAKMCARLISTERTYTHPEWLLQTNAGEKTYTIIVLNLWLSFLEIVLAVTVSIPFRSSWCKNNLAVYILKKRESWV